MPRILASGRPKQEYGKFKASPDYLGMILSKEKKIKGKKKKEVLGQEVSLVCYFMC